ncbi:MAG TPA: DUF1499 domain-containing protein, partial [Nitrosomonas sp.]|nr:DUF1499 domain-containing protein [Nitrosomonas sp.]
MLARSKDVVFKQALQLVKSRSWEIAAASAMKVSSKLQLQHRSWLSKMSVIRIQSTEDKTRVDMRSVS